MSLKDFQILNKIGEGAYSSVYRVKRIVDNQEYALKKVKLNELSDKEKQNALNEVRILASIRSPYIVCYKEVFMTENSNYLCIIMEYTNNGDLYQKITDHQKKGQYVKEDEIWSIFIQLVDGLKALHDVKIFHRDVKSANVFLHKDSSIRLGDMNVSKIAKEGLLYTQTGTPYYASPEVWKDQPYDSKSDIWSLGCVLYELTVLKPPFRSEDMEGLYKKVIRGFYPKIPAHYSQDLSNMIRLLLQVNPHLRPNCDKILQLQNIAKRMDDSHFIQVQEDNLEMLHTIKIPKNIQQLNGNLPKSNYNPVKIIQLDRKNFFKTISCTDSDIKESINLNSQRLPQLSSQKEKSMIDLKYLKEQLSIEQKSKSISKKYQILDLDSSLIKSKPKLDNYEKKLPKKIDEMSLIYGGNSKNSVSSIGQKKNAIYNKLPKLKISKDENQLPKILPNSINKITSDRSSQNAILKNKKNLQNSIDTHQYRLKQSIDQQDSNRKQSKKKLDISGNERRLDYLLNLKKI